MKKKTARILASATFVGTMVAGFLPAVSGASTSVSASSFTPSYSAMFGLASVAAAGHGGVGVILPDEVSSNRYVEFDSPNIVTALTDAGLSTSDYNVQNALGNAANEISIAKADVTAGDKVLIMDPLDSTTGTTIETYAKAHNVAVVDYDRLTLGGSAKYYVSFDNVAVGTLIGNGELSCLTADHVTKPVVYVMNGDTASDNNATLFAQGYDAVLNAKGYSAGVNGAKPNTSNTINQTGTGSWTPSKALAAFEGAYVAHPSINAVVTPNDENAAPIISYLQGKGLGPNKIPFTGQDATLTGFQNIISGYQCGTVYKPVWQEAQAAVALALYLRAGQTPPAALVNGKTTDSVGKRSVSSVLLTATWVTKSNIESTVVANGVISTVALCTSQKPTAKGQNLPSYNADCAADGIK